MHGAGRIAVVCLTAVWCANAASTPPLAVVPINEESIAQMRKDHPLASAEVDDPVYKRTQRYQGFWLRDVLSKLQGDRKDSGLYVRFRCKDGYLPVMPLSRAMAAKGLIAIRDANAPQGQDWQPIPGAASSALAPSYLVWISPPAGPEDYPWPYQMVAIELISSSDVSTPQGAEASKPGRELFVMHCAKCHAINGVGGTMGPELNSPCSVTEYWNPRLLPQFISNASSVRAGTKMPTFDSLTAADIQAIVAYFQSMAGHKNTGAVCP